MLKSDSSDPEQEIDRLLKQLHAVPSQFHPALDSLRHEITRLSTGINVLNTWGEDPAIEDRLWFGYGLTPFEAKSMIALRKAGPAGLTKERLMAAVYANQAHDWPELKILDVRIYHIRNKLLLAKAPWWIETITGSGWVLHEGEPVFRTAPNGSYLWSKEPQSAIHHRRVLRNKAAKPPAPSA